MRHSQILYNTQVHALSVEPLNDSVSTIKMSMHVPRYFDSGPYLGGIVLLRQIDGTMLDTTYSGLQIVHMH